MPRHCCVRPIPVHRPLHKMGDFIMAHQPAGVIGGFDCHTETHTVVALDPLGQLLATATFDTRTSATARH